MNFIIITLIGLCFGSFASVLIYRIKFGKKGILTGRSYCPECKHKLGVKDLVPLLSYISTKGKCRYCKKSIGIAYPALELLMGGFFLLTAYLIGTENITQLIFYLFITFVFVLVTMYDILYQEIPDEVVLPAIVITIAYQWITGGLGAVDLWTGIAIPTIFFGALFFASRGRWLGGGDIRVGALMGAILGWPNILLGLFLGYLTGALFSTIGLITGKISRKSLIPFAPFLLLGTYIAWFWGEELIKLYLNL